MTSEPDKNYQGVLTDLKEKIRLARMRASLTANTQLLAMYWEIGNTILKQRKQEGWGTKIIDRLAHDLHLEFPEMKGLSVRNIKYMRTFAESYPHFPFVQQPAAKSKKGSPKKSFVQQPAAQPQNIRIVQRLVAQLPWGHKVSDKA